MPPIMAASMEEGSGPICEAHGGRMRAWISCLFMPYAAGTEHHTLPLGCTATSGWYTQHSTSQLQQQHTPHTNKHACLRRRPWRVLKAAPAHINNQPESCAMVLSRHKRKQPSAAIMISSRHGLHMGEHNHHLVLDGQLVLACMGSQQTIDLASNEPWLHCDLAAITLRMFWIDAAHAWSVCTRLKTLC